MRAPNGSPVNVLIGRGPSATRGPVSLPAYFNHRIFSSIQPRFIHHVVMVVAWLPFRLALLRRARKYGRIICADCSFVPTRRSFAQHFARINWPPTRRPSTAGQAFELTQRIRGQIILPRTSTCFVSILKYRTPLPSNFDINIYLIN